MDLRTNSSSLQNISWLVFIIETSCVYCAVRIKILKISGRSRLRRLVAGVSSRRSGFDPMPWRVRCVVEVAVWRVSLPVLRISPVSTIPSVLPTSSACCWYQKRAKHGSLPKKTPSFFGNRVALDRKVLSLPFYASVHSVASPQSLSRWSNKGLAPQLKADYHHVSKISDRPAIGEHWMEKHFHFPFHFIGL